MTDTPNQLTPKHYAALLILKSIADIDVQIDNNNTDRLRNNYFRSQIDVWLRRTREELTELVNSLSA